MMLLYHSNSIEKVMPYWWVFIEDEIGVNLTVAYAYL